MPPKATKPKAPTKKELEDKRKEEDKAFEDAKAKRTNHVESDEFKTVIEEIPCDDEWYVQNHMERAFSKAGLKRYRWDMKRLVH